MQSIIMYVRVEVDQQRQFIEIDNIQQLTFRVFVKSGEWRMITH